jgi:protein-disulfide isomerase
MVVATFMDFTCPFCRDLVPVLDSLRTEFGERVAIEFHFFPLFGHQHAGPAAAAADCAHDQGFFYEMYHALFTQADSFGTKPWGVLATEAGVPDVEKFGKCIRKSPKTFDRIYAGKELGRRIGVNGTPEVWVNGQLFLGRNLAAFRDRARELGLH